MNLVSTPLKDLYVIEPKVFGDERGFFMETYSERAFHAAGLPTTFVQDNFSRSARGTLRGLHFQTGASAQGKLVRVTLGAVWDVCVDLRPRSATFRQWFAVELSAENKKSMYVPEGFAHGFCVLSDLADFQYKVTRLYDPAAESGVIWNDPELKISWPLSDPILSAKDQNLKKLSELKL